MTVADMTLKPDNWGGDARFGLFIVGVEAVPEAEWWAMAPPGVSIHVARVSAPAPWGMWDDARETVELAPDLARGAAQFAGMALSAVVLAHSSSSIAGGRGWDEAATRALRMHLDPATAVTTNGEDCALALRHLGVSRPYLVFPPWFGDGIIATGRTHFAEQGFADGGAMRNDPGRKWAETPPGQLYGQLMHLEQDAGALADQIVANCPAEADGVLIVGTGLRCVGIIEPLETALGRPVVSANQASLWRCLRLAGMEAPVPGYGRLLAG